MIMTKFDIEINDQQITQYGINAIIDFYDTLSIDKISLPHVQAFATGVKSMFLNVVLDTRVLKQHSIELIKQCQEFFNKKSMPWAWFIIPGSMDNDLDKCNCHIVEESPAMYFDLSQTLNASYTQLQIKALDQYNDLQEWISPIKEGFGADPDDDSFRALNAKLLNNGCNKLRHYVAYHNGVVVTSGTLFISNSHAMLHNLATRNEYIKQGFGTALTLYMMQEAKNLGIQHCFLDSSPEGFNMYKKIGFKIYSTTIIYTSNV